MRAATRSLAGHEFWLVGPLQLRRTADGQLEEYTHKLPPGVQANAYASGPFCYMDLPAAPNAEGVFAIFLGEGLQYIGECQNLLGRFSSQGYGQIHPQNCHLDGQSTVCKINAWVLAAAKIGLEGKVWFCPSAKRDQLKAELISTFSPSWNEQEAGVVQRAAEPEKSTRQVPLRATAPKSKAPRTEATRQAPMKAPAAKRKASRKEAAQEVPQKAPAPKRKAARKEATQEVPQKAPAPKRKATRKEATRQAPKKAPAAKRKAPRKEAKPQARKKAPAPKKKGPRKEDFEKAILALCADAERTGQGSIKIQARDLLKKVGGDEGANHVVRECCSAMRALMVYRDEFIHEPPRGDDPRLKIEYQLPRPTEGEGLLF